MEWGFRGSICGCSVADSGLVSQTCAAPGVRQAVDDARHSVDFGPVLRALAASEEGTVADLGALRADVEGLLERVEADGAKLAEERGGVRIRPRICASANIGRALGQRRSNSGRNFWSRTRGGTRSIGGGRAEVGLLRPNVRARRVPN